MTGWDVHVAAAGLLRPWNGHEPHAAASENNLWARRAPSEPWLFEALGEQQPWRRHFEQAR
jgi:hypothetical protein